MMLNIVLLPQPDGPTRLTKRPCGIDSVTGASAWKTPAGVVNAMLTSSTQSFGAEDGMRTPLVSGTISPVPGTISQKTCQRPFSFTSVNAGRSKFQAGCR